MYRFTAGYICFVITFRWLQSSQVISSPSVSVDQVSGQCLSRRHRTGTYNGIAVFVRFIERESLTLSRDDLLELNLVRPLYTVVIRFIVVLYVTKINSSKLDKEVQRQVRTVSQITNRLKICLNHQTLLYFRLS